MKQRILTHIQHVCNLQSSGDKCGMTCVSCDMDDGWEEWCGCGCHKNYTESPVHLEHLLFVLEKSDQSGFIEFCEFLWRHNLKQTKMTGAYDDVPAYNLTKSVSENLDNPELLSLVAKLLNIK